ncbi:MAG: GntR family transcriptional regulator [Burkholderiales bacterium]|jgi:DNA-binding transcriptional regulator YhcF (GntR family)|nr:GntR family transcriptional regulator [Burkholderiales bacterium]
MDFNTQKPIFLQIYDLVLEQILNNQLTEGTRIASVREMAANMQVNPNTVQRAYTELQAKGILTQQRGIGYFIGAKAKATALAIRRDEFMRIQLPLIVRQMKTLGITWEELQNVIPVQTGIH